jgi:hypothetical protein
MMGVGLAAVLLRLRKKKFPAPPLLPSKHVLKLLASCKKSLMKSSGFFCPARV